MRRLTLAFALLGGCTGSFVGGGDDDDDDDVGADAGANPNGPDAAPLPQPSFAATLAPLSAELALGESTTFTVTLTSENGFAGAVTLTATGLPETWSVTFEPSATADVPAGGSVDVTLRLQIPTDAISGAGTIGVTADATVGQELTEAAAVTVVPELRVHIPANALNNPSEAFGGSLTVRYVTPGTTITWINDDAIAHRIHADGINGFVHQDNDMGPGGTYSVVVLAPGIYDYSCHLHGSMTGQIVVADP
jgi:plastocyanin